MSVDDLVAEVFGTLEQTGQADNTLAFFLSDNGFLWNEHGLIGSVASKNNPYQESIQIPFFVRWPGHFAPGLNDPRLVATIDIAPTIYDATGTGASYVVDGRSLLDRWTRDRMLVEFSAQGRFVDWASTVMRNYRYTEYYGEGGRVDFREYYDLKKDPWELRNLLAGRLPDRERFRRADARLAADRSCAGVTCP